MNRAWPMRWASVPAVLALLSAAGLDAQVPPRLAGEDYRVLDGTRARVHYARDDSAVAARLLELVEA